jgi:hypothetical protein
VPVSRCGTLEAVGQARGGAAPKTLFLFDPALKDPAEQAALAHPLLPRPPKFAAAAPEFIFGAGTVGFYFHHGTLVEIVNENRTATSYRTAFSHFLAEPLG